MTFVEVALLVVAAAGRHNVPAHQALAVAWHESRLRPDAVAIERDGTRSFGVMQLNTRSYPRAAELTPAENIEIGVARFAHELKRHGTWSRAWRSYRGIGAPKVAELR